MTSTPKNQEIQAASPQGSSDSLSRFLGYASVGLGLAQTLAPHAAAKLTGVGRHGLMRAIGVRGLISGIGLLTRTHPAGWLLARVAGDAIDMLTLKDSLQSASAPKRKRTLSSMLAVAGVTALDLFCAKCHSMRKAKG